jgi:penicillin-binding protein 2
VGQSGVEAAYDAYLRGRDGAAGVLVDALGRPRGRVRVSRSPAVGNAVRLTIDLDLQRAAERALRYGLERARQNKNRYANGGAIVALDPRDGAVLAMASAPTYKPSVFAGPTDARKLAPLSEPESARSANYPGLNRAVQGLYPPGSTFKPVTALAAMQERLLEPYAPLPCTPSVTIAGQTFRNWNPAMDAQMTLPTALAASCDTYFYRIGYDFYRLPAQRGQPLQEWARRFGFGARAGNDIGGEEHGLLPTIGWRERTYTKRSDPCCWQVDRLWKPGDSVQLAIGQKDLLVTPLQMTRFYALLANGGRLVTPHLLADVEAAGSGGRGRLIKRVQVAPPTRVAVDPAALAVVRRGLLEATHETFGTSAGVFGAFPVAVAGKTGTAEKAVQVGGTVRLLSQSWWCGYAPAAAPTIALCAVIENGGFGGEAAAPAALKVMQKYFRVADVRQGSVPSD